MKSPGDTVMPGQALIQRLIADKCNISGDSQYKWAKLAGISVITVRRVIHNQSITRGEWNRLEEVGRKLGKKHIKHTEKLVNDIDQSKWVWKEVLVLVEDNAEGCDFSDQNKYGPGIGKQNY